MSLYLKTLIPDCKGTKPNCQSIDIEKEYWQKQGIKQKQISEFVL